MSIIAVLGQSESTQEFVMIQILILSFCHIQKLSAMPYCSNRRMRATGCRTPESNFSMISSAKIDKDCDMQENIRSVVLVQARLFPECHTKDTIATRAYGQIIVGMYLLPTRMGLHRCIPLPECHVIFEFFQECANFFLNLLESVHFLVFLNFSTASPCKTTSSFTLEPTSFAGSVPTCNNS